MAGQRTSRPAVQARRTTVARVTVTVQPASAEAAVGGFHRASDVDPGARVEFAEHVADVRLDGLLAEKQLACDFGVGLAVDEQLGDLELATGQRAHAAVCVARPGAPVDVLA